MNKHTTYKMSRKTIATMLHDYADEMDCDSMTVAELLADLKEWADMWEHHMGVETVCEACGTVWDGRLRGDDGHPYCADHVRMGG